MSKHLHCIDSDNHHSISENQFFSPSTGVHHASEALATMHYINWCFTYLLTVKSPLSIDQWCSDGDVHSMTMTTWWQHPRKSDGRLFCDQTWHIDLLCLYWMLTRNFNTKVGKTKCLELLDCREEDASMLVDNKDATDRSSQGGCWHHWD